MTARVLSIGQCGFDGPSIAAVLRDQFDLATDHADSVAEALEDANAGDYALILVNRILDSTGEDGCQLITELKRGPAADTPVMLVSNYDDAQQRAVKLGAEPGFGKSDLGEGGLIGAVREALG